MPHLQHGKAVLGEGTVPLPQTCSVTTSSPTDSSDTHEGCRKQFWGAESYSPGGSEYFPAGLSLGSPMSSPAHAGSDVQDEVGVQGKEQGPRPRSIPSSTSVHCSCEPWLAPQSGCASRDKLLLQWQQHWQAIPSVLTRLGAKSTRKNVQGKPWTYSWKEEFLTLQSNLPELVHQSPYMGKKKFLSCKGSTQLKWVLRKTEERRVLQLPRAGLLLRLSKSTPRFTDNFALRV